MIPLILTASLWRSHGHKRVKNGLAPKKQKWQQFPPTIPRPATLTAALCEVCHYCVHLVPRSRDPLEISPDGTVLGGHGRHRLGVDEFDEAWKQN